MKTCLQNQLRTTSEKTTFPAKMLGMGVGMHQAIIGPKPLTTMVHRESHLVLQQG